MEPTISERKTNLGASGSRNDALYSRNEKNASYDELGSILDDNSSCRSYNTLKTEDLEKLSSDDATVHSGKKYPSIPKIKTYEEDFDSDAENKIYLANVPKPSKMTTLKSKKTATFNLEIEERKVPKSKDEIKSRENPEKLGMSKNVTVPKSPRLATMAKNGRRSYSCVTPTKERVEEVDNWKDRKLTVPIAPRLATAKNGERNYSTVSEVKVVEEKVDNWKDRKPTIPIPPRLTLLAIKGEKSYSCTGIENPPIEESILHSNSLEKKPTVPQSPKLMTRAKYGDRCYSSVADSSPMRSTKESDYPAWNEYKEKLIDQGVLRESSSSDRPLRLTVPDPFPLSTPSPRIIEDKNEETPQHKFKARPLPNFSYEAPLREQIFTVPKPFHLSSDGRESSRPRSSCEESPKHKFKARPVPDFSFQPPQREQIVTVPTPFRLSSNGRDSRERSSSPSIKHIPDFKAPFLPDFNLRSQSPLPKARSPSKVFTPPGTRKLVSPRTKSVQKVTRSPSVEKRRSKSATKAHPTTPRGRSKTSSRRSFTPNGRNPTLRVKSRTPESKEGSISYQFKAREMPDFSKPFLPKKSPRVSSAKPVRILPHTSQFRARKVPDFSKPFTPTKRCERQANKSLNLDTNLISDKVKANKMETQKNTQMKETSKTKNDAQKEVVIHKEDGDKVMFDLQDMEKIRLHLTGETNDYESSIGDEDNPLLLVMSRLNKSLEKFKAYEQAKLGQKTTKKNKNEHESKEANEAHIHDKVLQENSFTQTKANNLHSSTQKAITPRDDVHGVKLNVPEIPVGGSFDSQYAFENKSSCSDYNPKLEISAEDNFPDEDDAFENKTSCTMLSITDIASAALSKLNSERHHDNGGDSANTNSGDSANTNSRCVSENGSGQKVTSKEKTNCLSVATREADKTIKIQEVEEMTKATTPKHNNKKYDNNELNDVQTQGDINTTENKQQNIKSLFNPSSGDSSTSSSETDDDETTDTMTGSLSTEMNSLTVLPQKISEYEILSQRTLSTEAATPPQLSAETTSQRVERRMRSDDETTDTMTGSSSSEMNSLTVIPETGDYGLLSHGTLSSEVIPLQLSVETATQITEKGMKSVQKKGRNPYKEYSDEYFDDSMDKKIEKKKGKKHGNIGKFFNGQKFIYKLCCAVRDSSPATRRVLRRTSRNKG